MRRIISLGLFFLCIPLAWILRFKRGTKTTLYGWYGASDSNPIRNQGDNLILESMLPFASTLGRELTLCLLEDNQQYASHGRVVNVRHAGWQRYVQWLRIIAQTELLIFGGGGLFYDLNGDGGSPLGLWKINFLFGIAQRKIVWWSMGVGPLKSKRAMKCTERATRYAAMITVRDEDSRQLLISCGADGEKVFATADAAYGFVPLSSTSLRPVLGERTRIGISVLPFYSAAGLGSERDEVVYRQYKILAEGLVLDGYEVVFVVMVNDQDSSVCDRMVREIDSKYVTLQGVNSSLTEVANTIHELDIMLAMRYHSYVLAMLLGVPVTGVGYHPKVRSLISELGAGAYSCDLESVSAEKLRANIEYVLVNQKSVLVSQKALIDSKRDKLNLNYEICRTI